MAAEPLPMFPLGAVLLPTQSLPLHVFEERYRVMTRRCLEDDRRFGVVLIERGHEVADADGRRHDVTFSVGTVAEIVRAAELPDGRFVMEAVGRERLRVERWLPDDPHPRAEVTVLTEDAAGPDTTALLGEAAAQLQRILALRAELGDPAPPVGTDLDDDPVTASFQLAGRAGLTSLDAYRLLAEDRLDLRLRRAGELLDDLELVLRSRLGA